MASTVVLQNQIGYGAATITINKIRFSEVSLSGTTRLKGKLAFLLLPFYPNKCRFLGGPPLGGLLTKPIDLSCLLEDGFN